MMDFARARNWARETFPAGTVGLLALAGSSDTPPSVTEAEMMDHLDELGRRVPDVFPEKSGVVLVEPGSGRDSRIFGRGNSIRHGFRMAGRRTRLLGRGGSWPSADRGRVSSPYPC